VQNSHDVPAFLVDELIHEDSMCGLGITLITQSCQSGKFVFSGKKLEKKSAW
jgi:hypothetical protein